jgi:hypothetical protein
MFLRGQQRNSGEPFGEFVADVTGSSAADARRLAACWNACQGLSTEALEAAQPPAQSFTPSTPSLPNHIYAGVHVWCGGYRYTRSVGEAEMRPAPILALQNAADRAVRELTLLVNTSKKAKPPVADDWFNELRPEN